MTVSLFDIFKIGIGPSSSHTVGPMKAAGGFVRSVADAGKLGEVRRVTVELYGSLALTGPGHGTDTAVILGLAGAVPETIDPDDVARIVTLVRATGTLPLGGGVSVAFDHAADIVMHGDELLPRHVNGMRFSAFGADGSCLQTGVYYSIGGGFVVSEEDAAQQGSAGPSVDFPYPFKSSADLLAMAQGANISIAELALANERVLRSADDVTNGLHNIWRVMGDCIRRGMSATGHLPGPLGVPRRAGTIHKTLRDRVRHGKSGPLEVLDWVNLFAIAVNEENAAGGRVVTAPTNGAAGIIPAVVSYYERFCQDADETGIFTFFLTAGAIGGLYKENASISGAEMGCQGEVGVACSMAAAGLAAALGATNRQIENAAEIGMEHNLGLTCDPVGGLVQIPCIERNAMGAVKAINAASIALEGDGSHVVPLDTVIETMRQTGVDMQSKYKETSRGGLAVNMVDC